MANIKRIDGKTGTSYKITVTRGRDLDGKQVRHYKTWVPPRGMTERQMEKEIGRVAHEFERAIELGYAPDNRQTFAQYAGYVLGLKERNSCKHRTIERYKDLLRRINPAIGHFKLVDIRPWHLNELYEALGKPGVSDRGDRATARVDLATLLKTATLSRSAAAASAGISTASMTVACKGQRVELATANAIASALGKTVGELFTVERGDFTLSNKTILEYHRLIHTILAQAETEMLVPYNAAAKASPPKVKRQAVNYFQLDQITAIRNALDTEPLKWRVAVNLLLITGCRRGEVMGMKWSNVELDSSRVKIDSALLYSPQKGIYESDTKTGNTRFIKLPAETVELLRAYRRWWLELKLKNGDRWKETGYLFVRDDGSPTIPDALTAWLADFSKRHGLPHINPHAFRHTMASVLIHGGQDVVSVSKRLGHAKVSTTTDIYSHIMQEADEQAGECLADAMLRAVKQSG